MKKIYKITPQDHTANSLTISHERQFQKTSRPPSVPVSPSYISANSAVQVCVAALRHIRLPEASEGHD